MTETRSGSAKGRAAAGREPETGLGGSVFWIVAAGAVLVLGLALRTGAPSDAPSDTPPAASLPQALAPRRPPPPAPDPPARESVLPLPAPLPPPAGPAARVVERALRDARRASRVAAGWTAQVAVLCDPAGAEAVLSRFETESRLYVFPAEIGERSCFRICWGSYPDEAGARAASVPPSLTGGAKTTPKRLAEVLP